MTLWDSLLDGKVAPDAFFDLALQSLPREADEQMTSRMLGYASNTWWRFLDAPARTTRAARFESLLREGLGAAAHPEPEGLVVRHAAKCRRHARHTSNWLRAGVGEKGNGHRAAARGSRLHRARPRAGGSRRSMAGTRSSRRSWRGSRIPIARAAFSS